MSVGIRISLGLYWEFRTMEEDVDTHSPSDQKRHQFLEEWKGIYPERPYTGSFTPTLSDDVVQYLLKWLPHYIDIWRGEGPPKGPFVRAAKRIINELEYATGVHD